MLWLALRFPSLPLEIFTRATDARRPLAVTDPDAADAGIVACNPVAGQRGVRPGMTATAAWALAADLAIFERDVAAERAALERIAAWALQFSPVVSIAHPAEVLVEVEGSLRLLGGLNRAWADVERGVRTIGYTTVMAGAPTPLAAQLFARAGLSPRIRHDDALRAGLDRIPTGVLDLPRESVELLRDVGVRTLGECRQLPRDGLARRGGKALLEQIDLALGRIPDPRPTFVPFADFQATLPLPAPVTQADALLFAARRLIAELCGWLAATRKGVQRLAFTLAHERNDETRFTLDLMAATRDPAHLASLLRERLDRLALASPVVSIAMTGEKLLPLASHNLSFLPDEREPARLAVQLIERLQARLGAEAVRGLATTADHRPERAWRACEPGGESGAPGGRLPSDRPLWLLGSPRPLAQVGELPHYEGPLTLLTRAERIESGWWDDNDVKREYYVARTPGESLLWIYRESGGWYLHGYFS